MRARVLFALAFAAGPVVADEPAVPPDSLFPLAVGNTWTYRVGSQEDRFVVRQEDRFVVRAARLEMVGSQTCFLLEAQLRDKVVATEHLAFTQDGLYRFKAEQAEVVPPVCVLRLPAPKGRWPQKYALNGREATYTFRMDLADVTVPAGKYPRATRVQVWTGEPRGPVLPPPRTTIWYAAGVGPVKQFIDEGKGRFLELELEKFEKGK